MCLRDEEMAVVSLICDRPVINAGTDYKINQRPGRVRLIVSLDTAGFLLLTRDANIIPSNSIVSIQQAAGPVTIDYNHFGRVVEGELHLYNPGVTNITVTVCEVVAP